MITLIQFPGSNCDHDAQWALEQLGAKVNLVWHNEHELPRTNAIVLPGGFSYGDHLRAGAIAARSPVMDAVRKEAARGVPVIGICNGFQILTESGLLPGALVRNTSLHFLCQNVHLRVESINHPFGAHYKVGQELVMPIAHNEGAYFAEPETLERLQGEQQIVFRYLENPNGSQNDIAGIVNAERNVLGMMPHPERACDPLLGSTDGRGVFQSLLEVALQVSGS